MEFNNKKLSQTSKIVNLVIASLLCIFLIALTSIIIGDLDKVQKRPYFEDYMDHAKIDSINSERNLLESQINDLYYQQDKVRNKLRVYKNDHTNKKQSFDNWLQTRKTVGSSINDKEVLTRTNELDELYEKLKNQKNKLVAIEDSISKIDEKREATYYAEQKQEALAFVKENRATKKYELNIFLIRLAFVFPILLIGVWFVLKFRKHKYWPLFFGFVLFSGYAFFFGLLPYLPSYGGYIRYSVGILLSIAGGIYFINFIRKFIERKKAELNVSQKERSKSVKLDTAEKALDNHMCPSCGKDFIPVVWDKSALKVKKIQPIGLATHFCRFCGLELFRKCEKCGTENFVHLPFCSCCGSKVNDK